MLRKSEEDLIKWLHSAYRKPLILRGARQVGKSTLVRNIAKREGLNLAEVNLEQFPLLEKTFQTLDPGLILRALESTAQVSLAKPNTLLFLDEIQSAPSVLPALRYLYEHNSKLPIIGAGSLLEFVLSDHSFSMPVGRVEYYHLGPMTFMEFLKACGDDFLHDELLHYDNHTSWPENLHHQLLLKQREFLFTGGMPAAVLAYSQTKSPEEARRIHRQIVQTYQDDFAKYGKHNDLLLLNQVMATVPRLVGQKIKFASMIEGETSHRVKKAVDLLVKARLLSPVYHTDCSGLPLKAGRKNNVFKLFFIDCGLFNYMCGLSWQVVSELKERDLINEGSLAEQFIAQHLVYFNGGFELPELNYWLRENKSQNAEVDFIVESSGKIIPVEVKAGKSGQLKSLLQLMAQKKLDSAIRFDLNPPSVQKISHFLPGTQEKLQAQFELKSLPLYMVERFVDL